MDDIIIFFIECVLTLGVIILLGWGIWIFSKNPSKIKNIFSKTKDIISERAVYSKEDDIQEQNKVEQKEIIRDIVRAELGEWGNKIICSFPRQNNNDHDELISEVRYNRQLLEKIITSLEKKQEIQVSTIHEKVAITRYPMMKYARMVDSTSPAGFFLTSLFDFSNGTCYMITIHSEYKATYRLVTDLAIQREIIAMFNPIITSGCEYDEEPTSINEIIHLEDGILELHSGIWRIIKKAKIRFI